MESGIIDYAFLRASRSGHAWIEYRPEPEDGPGVPWAEYIQECVWIEENMMLRDVKGAVSTARWNYYEQSEYNSTWRAWNHRPEMKEAKELPWKEQTA